MIVRSPSIFAAILVASSAVHLAAMTMIWTEPSVDLEGGSPVAESSLGSSFADLAQGVQQPVKPVTEVSAPVAQTARRPVAVEPVSSQPSAQSAVATPKATATTEASSVKTATKPLMVDAVRQQSLPTARTEAQPVSPETAVSALPETLAPPVSVRPQKRAERPDPPKVTPAPQPAKPRGNADRNARAGTQSGNAAKVSQPRQARKERTQKAQGNAAASNYPGQVMRRISRVPRPRTSARGEAVITFTIAANGSLASAGVAGSSGSVSLDQAALAVVRMAQPFPPPPTGARRSYSIKIKGR